jgi:hypothetical protein
VAALKAGYAFAGSSKKVFNEYSGDFKNRGGAMVNPEFGFKIAMSERVDFMLTIGYWYQHVDTKVKSSPGWTHNRSSDLNRLSFSVGISLK